MKTLLVLLLTAVGLCGQTQGSVAHLQLMNSNWDSFTTAAATTPAVATWINANVPDLITYSPYFDPFQVTGGWRRRYGAVEVYIDSYAIYPGDAILSTHPEYVMHDVSGNPLYIPWGCSGGTCPQYAGDFTNPGFISYMVSKISTITSTTYASVFFDDVNLALTASDNYGTPTAPKDASTGFAMTAAAWKHYFAAYTAAVKAALPSMRFNHNGVWTAGDPFHDTDVLTQMQSATRVNVERGFGDPGITGGTGVYSLGSLMTYIYYVHAYGGVPVNIEDYYVADQAYSTACYFLVQEAGDTIGFADEVPNTFGSPIGTSWGTAAPAAGFGDVYSANLGTATNYHFWNTVGLWERDFTNGIVLVNEPGAAYATQSIPSGYHLIGSTTPVTSVTLGPKQGVVLVNN